ncbi:zinc finger protein 347-like [Anoplophora glabripennis]|uniref:zinc finger protein 347-like n=1 Tax=Anoplophora glabripennis TaxID=217634 RepID=UPI0008738395|nr:zinc finger protein 347-like [Anoplophora glabripennis]
MQATIFEEAVCRLCLNTVRNSNCRVIEEVIRDVLKIVLPNVNLEERLTHVMCTTCSVKLFAAFNFKSVCMDTEDLIFPYINASKISVIDLKEVYLKEKGNIQLTDVSEDWTICRLCFQPVTYGFVALNEVDVDIIDTYIPQVNVNATRDPCICMACFDSLRTHDTFLKNCLDAHVKYSNVDKQSYIKTEEIQIKPEDHMDGDALQQTFYNEPFEKRDCKDAQEDGCKVENGAANKCHVKIKQRYLLRHKNISKIRMHQHESCNYKPKCKSNLAKHQVKPKAELYKCNFCDFKTKWRTSFDRHYMKHKDSNKCDEYDYKTKYKVLPDKGTSQLPIYKCHGCNYESMNKSNFTKHQLVHKDSSQVQMYRCKDCDYETKYKNNIKIHQLKHKDPSQIQMHSCTDCDYTTKYKHHIKQHELKHKDPSQIQMYRCNDCNYQTELKGKMKIHQLKHKDTSQVQMYRCNDCDFETKYKNHISGHQLKHKDPSHIQMYRCSDCDYESKYSSYIKKHQLIHKDPSQV